MSTMGDRIKSARENKGLLQSQLADLISVKSGAVISNWEKNINKPDADKIVKLCDVLDVSLAYLLNYYGAKAPAYQELSTEALYIASLFDRMADDGRALIRNVVAYIEKAAMRAPDQKGREAAQSVKAWMEQQGSLQSESPEAGGLKNG